MRKTKLGVEIQSVILLWAPDFWGQMEWTLHCNVRW